MFESTVQSLKNKLSWHWTWPQIFIVVILLLAGIQLYRVNAVRLVSGVETARFISTAGVVADGRTAVSAGSFLSFQMDFNSRVTLKGWFASGSKDVRIECLVLKKDMFELWKNHEEFQAVSKTGVVPSGRIERVLEPGTYYLIFDNRLSGGPEKTFETFFEIH